MTRPSSIQSRVFLLLSALGLWLVAFNAWDDDRWMRQRELRVLREEAETQGTGLAGMMQQCFRNNLRRNAELQMSYASMTRGLAEGVVVDEVDVIRFATRLDWVGMKLAESPLHDLAAIVNEVRTSMSGDVSTRGTGAEIIAAHPFFTHYESSSRGAVLLRFDGTALLHRERLEALYRTTAQACVVLAFCVLAWLVMDLLITDRVRKVLAQAGPSGQMETELGGNDELAQISREFAQSVARLRETEARMLEAAEQERRRIGRDLHDDVCQRLAAMQLMTGVLSRALGEEGSRHLALVEKLMAKQSETSMVVRHVAAGLAPVWVETGGLVPALKELSSQIEKSFGVPCQMDCSLGDFSLAVWVQTHVFRILQELATNAARHAGASHIWCRASIVDNVMRLEVENDGVTFDGPQPATRGLGLSFVQQRARALGGRLSFSPRSGGGTLALCETRLCEMHSFETAP